MMALVIDGGLLHADFAVSPEGCVQMFTSRIEAIREHVKKQHDPVVVVVAFDSQESRRRELYPNYKANREPTEGLAAAKRELWNECAKLEETQRIHVNGWEADDIFASVAAHQTRWGHQTILVTKDKDARQCLRQGLVTIISKASRDQGRLFLKFLTEADHVRETHLRPDQWPDYQALVGDTADNLPGCPGIGKTQAAEMLDKYGTIEGILEHIEELKPAAQKKLAGWETMKEMRALVRLNTDLEFTY